MIKGIWALFSFLFIFLWNRKSWLDHFMFIITLECSKLWIWMNIYFRDILLIKISRGANNCVHEWCIYIALYCVLLYTQSALQSCGGGGGGGLSSTTTSVQHPLGWCDGCHRTTAPHTSYRWRGERVIEPIKWMGIIRRQWLTRASGWNWPGHRGYTPTLYEKCLGIFNDHRESLTMKINFHSLLWSYLPRVPIFLAMTL